MGEKSDLNSHFARIDELGKNISQHVPINKRGTSSFRADLAGLLTVSIASTYENCVKDILQNYAFRHHENFGIFTINNFEKLNSKISINDLNRYSKVFNSSVHEKFKLELAKTKSRIRDNTGKNIETIYEQILIWRHDFAHAGKRNTTIEEALNHHRFAKHILLSFSHAFDRS